jgi:diguanylate cyclase (GGDEF)-like protein
MDRERSSLLAKTAIIALGGASLLFALPAIRTQITDPSFLLIVLFSTLVAPRMSLAVPRSRFAISFSDAAVFLIFLMYGGPAAIVAAACESVASCLYLQSKGYAFTSLMIPTNVAINVVSITLTYLAWLGVPPISLFTALPGSTAHLVSTLGSLAIFHFICASLITALFLALRDSKNMWTIWRRDCLSSAMTQIVGAGLAGMLFKIIKFGDVATGAIAFLALAIAYVSYRQSIKELNQAISQTEAAERERAEIERERRCEAEEHASQLTLSLAKEERANEALRKSEKDLQHAALFDPLTDLPNRKNFGDMLRSLITGYRSDPHCKFQVLFIDIRKFKNINDSLGHSIGDKVLKVAAKRFASTVNSSDLVARIGGDEFAVILKGMSTPEKARKVARRLVETIGQPFSLAGQRLSIGINVGIAPCDAEYNTPEEILRDADIAMHYAKENGSGVETFTKTMRVKFLERIRYEDDLRQAVDNGELSMAYQPLVRLHDGSLFGFEALLRWNHREFGQIPPNKFIPIAEESGLIIPITKWILETTCRQLAEWQEISPSYRNLVVSVNISGKHLSNEDLIHDVEHALAASGVKARSLKLEVTESAAMEDAEQTISILNRLNTLGVQLSIDDFGTGYSSLSYLHRLPFDTLKIDRSFVSSVGESGENSEILQTIISLAKNLKKKVIAEGIETEAQLHLLQDLGCDYGQGYLLSRPRTVEKIETALYEGRMWLPNVGSAGAAVELSVTEEALRTH